MKIAIIILSILNTLPLFIYPFTVVPLTQLLRTGVGNNQGGLIQFMTTGFAWGTLFYPAILAYNHFFSFNSFRNGQFKQSLTNQIITTFYLTLVIAYGFVAFRGD